MSATRDPESPGQRAGLVSHKIVFHANEIGVWGCNICVTRGAYPFCGCGVRSSARSSVCGKTLGDSRYSNYYILRIPMQPQIRRALTAHFRRARTHWKLIEASVTRFAISVHGNRESAFFAPEILRARSSQVIFKGSGRGGAKTHFLKLHFIVIFRGFQEVVLDLYAFYFLQLYPINHLHLDLSQI